MSAKFILVAISVLVLSCSTAKGSEATEQLNLAINQFESNQECFDIFDRIRMVVSGDGFPTVLDSEMDTLCSGVCGEIGRRILRYDSLARNTNGVSVV